MFILAEEKNRDDWPLFERAMPVELNAMEKNEKIACCTASNNQIVYLMIKLTISLIA